MICTPIQLDVVLWQGKEALWQVNGNGNGRVQW
jgi:hypothetical protein